MSDVALPAPAEGDNQDRRMAPVAAAERIDVIDILRGLALFGILAANMRGFNAPAEVYFNIGRMFSGLSDKVAQGFIDYLIQGKFVTLFAFLFGLGFAVQMSRAEEKGKSVWFYPRRLLVLLIIGLIHAFLIWWGDILVSYALTGFLLFFFRKARAKTVAIWAICLYALNLVLPLGFYVSWLMGRSSSFPGGSGDGQSLQHAIQIYRDGSFVAMTQQRIHDWWGFNHNPIFLISFVLPRFLAGLWVWKIGLLKDVASFLPRVKQVLKWALAIAIICDVTMWSVQYFAHPPRNAPSHWMLLGVPVYFTVVPATATVYACLVLLAVQSAKWKERLTPFGAVGRMALTNYLTQSLLCTMFFHWTRLYGKVGPAWDLVPTFLLYGAQVYLSTWWLQRYQFGPVEWLWRSLTYGRFQPMRRRLDPPLTSVATAAEA